MVKVQTRKHILRSLNVTVAQTSDSVPVEENECDHQFEFKNPQKLVFVVFLFNLLFIH